MQQSSHANGSKFPLSLDTRTAYCRVLMNKSYTNASSSALPLRSFNAGHVVIRQGDDAFLFGVVVKGVLS